MPLCDRIQDILAVIFIVPLFVAWLLIRIIYHQTHWIISKRNPQRTAVTSVDQEQIYFAWTITNWMFFVEFSDHIKDRTLKGPSFSSRRYGGISWFFEASFVKDHQNVPLINVKLRRMNYNLKNTLKVIKGTLSIQTPDGTSLKSESFYRKLNSDCQLEHHNHTLVYLESSDITSTDIKIVADFTLMVFNPKSHLKYQYQSIETTTPPSSYDQLCDDLEILAVSLTNETHDLTIQVQDESFEGHRALFAARSPVFRAMFKHPMTENASSEVKIDDTTPETWRIFHHFLYCAKISFDVTDLELSGGLMMLADKYIVPSLIEELESRLIAILTTENALTVLDLAEKYRLSRLQDGAVRIVQQHMDFFRNEKKSELMLRLQSSEALAEALLLRSEK